MMDNPFDQFDSPSPSPTTNQSSNVKSVQSPIDTALTNEGITGEKAEFIRSIYQQESGSGKNTTTSNAGAQGGMQIIPSTFKSVADKGWDIKNPVQNAQAGARYAAQMWDESGGDAKIAAAGYYGGPSGMAKAKQGIGVSDPRNPKAPNTLQYGDQVASRMGKGKGTDLPDSGNPFDQFDSPKTPDMTQPIKVKPIKSSDPIVQNSKLAEGLKNVASVADMIISFPGQAVGMAMGSASGLDAALKGKSHEEVQQIRSQAIKEYTEANPLNNPIHRIMTMMGYTDEYQKSDVDAVMTSLSGQVNKGGEYVEKITGGKIGKGDFNDLTNAALFLVAPKAVSLTGDVVGKAAQAGRLAADAGQSTIDMYPQVPKGITETNLKESPQVVQEKANIMRISGDETKTIDQRAQILMNNGVDQRIAKVLSKQNPELGEALEKMQAHKEAVVAKEGYNISGEAINKPINEKLPEEITKTNESLTTNIEDVSSVGNKDKVDSKYLGVKKQMGSMSPAVAVIAASTVGGAIYDQDNPLEGAFMGLAAGALMSKGIGMVGKTKAKAEFAKLGEEVWKPDFDTILNPRYMQRALQWTKSASQGDLTTLFQHTEEARKAGITPEMDRKFRDFSEGSVKALTSEEQELYTKYNKVLDDTIVREYNKLQPEDQKIIQVESTRLAKGHRAWWEAVSNPGEKGNGGGGFQKTPSISKSRSIFALKDGTIVTDTPLGLGKHKVTAWKANTEIPLGTSSKPLKNGGKFQGMDIVGAKQADIEMNTPVKYVDSDLATKSVKAYELMKYNREKELLANLFKGQGSKGLFIDGTKHKPPPDYVQPQGAQNMSSLRGIYMPKEYAEVFDDFIKKNSGEGHILEGVKNIAIRAMMVNPTPHIFNELAHWYDSRGLSGILSPVQLTGASKGLLGLAKTMPDSIRSVLLQDKFQVDLQKSGGMLMYPSVRNAKAWEGIFQTGLKDAVESKGFKEMAVALATTPLKLAARLSNNSAGIMWSFRDTLYTQLVKEQMLMGKTMAESVDQVGRHMPEYMIPSRVGFKGASGRLVSKALQSNLVVFSAYHYGLGRAVQQMGKELVSGKPGQMAEGLDRMAALAAGFYVMYPLMDKIYSKVFGNDENKQRRAGPYHIMDTTGKIMEGTTDVSALAMSLLTPNPAVQGAMEILNNHYGYSGQPIRYPGSSAKTQAVDTARFVGSKLAPAQAAMSMHEGRLSLQEYIYKQLDIISTSPAKKAAQEKAQKRAQAAAKSHQKKIEEDY